MSFVWIAGGLAGLGEFAVMTEDADAQPSEFNYDEANVPEYTLPDPLVFESGEPVKSAEDWARRRVELLELFRTHVYGHAPGPCAVSTTLLEEGKAFEGRVQRRQVRLDFTRGDRQHSIEVLVYRPTGAQRVPAFLGLNFNGNQSVADDPQLRITDAWVRSSRDGSVDDHRATEASRGASASRWPVETIVGRGYALVTAYYGDIDPDFDDGFENGIHALYPDFKPSEEYPARWGSIAGWAWGLSRILDYLQSCEDIEGQRVAVLGHSRLGKTALWAGASDPRFALVISNDSGCGGAALSRRQFGETVARINSSFPHWFCGNFHRYGDDVNRLPVDQHQLVALMAPRPVYVASAVQDLWADPRGEFLSAQHASPVYELLDVEGLPSEDVPAVDQSVAGHIGYHVRQGKHDVTMTDWNAYLDFADKHFSGK